MLKAPHTHTGPRTGIHTQWLLFCPSLLLLILLASTLQLMVTAELIASIHLILLGKHNTVSLPRTRIHAFCALYPLETDLFFIPETFSIRLSPPLRAWSFGRKQAHRCFTFHLQGECSALTSVRITSRYSKITRNICDSLKLISE